VKKKSPPYAIIGAVVLGIACIFLLFHIRAVQEQEAADREAKLKADMQAQIDAANAAKPAPTVTLTQTNMRPVYFATQPVQAGEKISSAFFEKKLTPNEILPDAYTDATDIVGFYAIRTIEKGDPLTPRNIGKTLPLMSDRISLGMRAVALPVFNADYNNTGGFIVDGDVVDLLFSPTVKLNGDDYKVNTQTVMQNVKILYVPGPKYESDQVNGVNPAAAPGEPFSVTFEVTPEQAQALIYMSSLKDGRFSMILRSRRDKEVLRGIKPFNGADYDISNLKKVQKTVDKSVDRVNELAKEIEAQEKAQGQGTTNETPTPKPPTP
jgi:Flp pilus assembly protein CpaB